MDPDTSVIVCTHDRARDLALTLDSLVRATEDSSVRNEIVVVDNNSSDDTPGVAERFAAAHRQRSIRLIFERMQGLSHARNAGIAASRGRRLVFIDDDVHVARGWLDRLLDAFALAPGVGAVAGRIDLEFAIPPPRWLGRRHHRYYSAFDAGRIERVLPHGSDFYGANCAVSRELTDTIGGFDTRLGRIGPLVLSGEDTDYARRAWEAGFSVAYAPEAAVRHRVPRGRLTLRWIGRRAYWQGATNVLLDGTSGPWDRAAAVSTLAVEGLVATLLLAGGPSRRFVRHGLRAARALGTLRALRELPERRS